MKLSELLAYDNIVIQCHDNRQGSVHHLYLRDEYASYSGIPVQM